MNTTFKVHIYVVETFYLHVLYILKCKYISTIIYVFLGKWSTKDASYFIIMETVVLQCITFIHLVIVPETYLWTFFSFENHM